MCEECKTAIIPLPAEVTDHIIPHKGDPALFWDPRNHQAMNKRCHDKKTAKEDGGFGSRQYNEKTIRNMTAFPEHLSKSIIPLTIVCGPPGSGKTTYANNHADPTDMIIDLDAIQSRLSGNPWYCAGEEWVRPALLERNRMLESLSTTKTIKAAWFIVSAPSRRERDWWRDKLAPKDIVVLDTPLDVCIDRLKNDQRRYDQADRFAILAKKWWEAYN